MIAAIGTGVLGGVYLVGLVAYSVFAVLRAGRMLDSVLMAKGLTAKGYMLWGRQYQGVLEGRQVHVYFMPASGGMRPAQLNLYVAADMGTRVALAPKQPRLDCQDCARVDIDAVELQTIRVYAQDTAWAKQWLHSLEVRETLAQLLGEQPRLGLRELYLQPDRLWLRAHPSKNAPAQCQRWLAAMLTLAEAGEDSDLASMDVLLSFGR